MKKWECFVCGWIYDEALGWPDDGIAPGTKWEDIPDDWACPDCGVGKDDFEMVEIKEPVAATAQDNDQPILSAVDPIIIIGSGLAAYNLVKEFRRLNQQTPLIMISRDDGSLYYKPNLSCGLTNEKTPDDLVMSYRQTIEQDMSVTLKAFTEVTAIDTAHKNIQINGESLTYSKLVLATGAGAVRIPFAGNAVDQMHRINDLLGYRKYRGDLVGKSKVAIIGAGLIGCEFTNDLLNHGVTVEVIDNFDHCMPNLLPAPAAKAVETALTDKGATFHFGAKVASVNTSTDGFTVGLEDGQTIETDLVVSAVGLRANMGLAEKAGLDIGRGISVNRYLETSGDDIYALGDCADVEGQLLMYVEPLLLSAKALAKTLDGERTAVDYKVMPVTVKTPACPVIVASPPAGAAGEWDITTQGQDVEALFRDESGEVIGFALTGNATDQKKNFEGSLPSLFK